MSYQELCIKDENGNLIASNVSLAAGEQTTLTIKYKSDDATTTGVGFTFNFDSQINSSVSLLHTADNIASGVATTADGTTSLAFGYASLFGAFPGSEDVDIATVTLTNNGNSAVTFPVYLAFTSSHAGYEEINCNPEPLPRLDITTFNIDENSGAGQVIATVDNALEGETFSLAGADDAASTEVIDAPAVQAGVQQVYVSETTVSGDQVIIKVAYQADDANTTGVGFTVDYDGSQLQMNSVADVFAGAIADGTESTDENGDHLTFGWASIFGQFPGSETAELVTITFDIVDGSSNPAIGFTETSSAATHTFEGSSHTVELPEPSVLSIDSATGTVTLNVNPDYESVAAYPFEIVSSEGRERSDTSGINNLDEVAPTITSGSDAGSVDENGPSQVVYTATADDSGDISEGVSFSLSGDSDAEFSIDADTGAVTFAGGADAEGKDVYNFAVIATDAAGNASDAQPVTLSIGDLDDAAPTVTSDNTATPIDENSGAGKVIYTATADDSGDDVADGPISYSLTAGSDAGLSIDSATGAVTLSANPDADTKSQYSFGVIATDAAGNASDAKSVTLDINNLDDTAPTITSSSVAAEIEENSGAGQPVYTATADDSADVSGGVTYSLAGTDADAFSIDENSGEVILTDDPDYEAKSSYEFDVVATDAANNSSSKTVTLAIGNVNDFKPVFSLPIAGDIDENSGSGNAVLTVVATPDPDVSELYPITYTLEEGSDAAVSIDSATGVVTLNADPDFEAQDSYSFTVVATDAEDNSSSAAGSISVNNLDEVAATITSDDTAASIDENGESQVIYTATADDSADISGGVTFSLTDDSDPALSIDAVTGAVTIAGAADHETQSQYSFGVVATDAAGNPGEAQSVTLDINDLDDAAPAVDSGDSANSVDENQPSGQIVYTATADDSADDVADGPVSFSLTGDSDSEFSIDSATGEVSFNATADHESDSEYTFAVVATDAAGNASEAQSVTMSINDLDDAAPTVTSGDSAASIDEANAADQQDVSGQVVYIATADDSGDDIADGPITFSLTDDSDSAMSIDGATGEVTLTANPDHEAQSQYTFAVVATDAAGNASAAESVTLNINDLDELDPIIKGQEVPFALASYSGAGQLVYQPSSDPEAEYETAFDDPNDVTGTLTFTLETHDPAHQNDFSIDSATGAVTYLPNPQTNLDNEYIGYTVTATDEAGNSASTDLKIVISGEELNLPLFGEPEGYQTEATASVVQNEGTDQEEYVTVATAVSGALSADAQSGDIIYSANVTDDTPMTYAVGASADVAENSDSNQVVYSALSTGYLAIDGFGNVSIHGTPWADGADSFEFTVTATDASGNQSQQAVTIDTNGYTADPATDGNVTYSLASGHDTALGINPQTGELILLESPDYEDTPQYAADIIVSDADGELYSYQVIIDVDNTDDTAPVITSGDTAAAIDENSGAGQVVYTAESDDSIDSSGSVSYSLSADSDLSLSIDAVTGEVTLAGNPDHETQSEYSFTVVAADAAGNSSEQSVTLQVNDLDEVTPVITSASSVSLDENNPADQVIYTAAAHDAASTVEQGAISQTFVNNGDGTLTVKLAIDEYYTHSDNVGLVAVGFKLAYESEQAGILSLADNAIVTPSNPILKMFNTSNYGEILFELVFGDEDLGSAYDVNSGKSIAEITFNVGDHDVLSTFTVTDLYVDELGQDTTNPPQTVNEYALNDGGRTSFSLADGHDDALSINASTGEVTLSGSADFESVESYAFTVVASDNSGNSSSESVTVSVNNLDEVAPTITSGATATAIDENSAAGQVIYTAIADDSADISGGVTFALSDDSDTALSIDAKSGAVTLADSPDQEVQDQYSFTVIATDAAGHESSETVTLDINDLDDTAAVVTSGDTATAIDENSGANQVIYTAAADDSADISDGPITFSLAEGSDSALSIDAATGEVSLSDDPDHETQAVYSFAVIATDAAGNASEAQSVTLNINDLDDTAATITSGDTAVAIDENSGAGQVVYTASADDSLDVSNGVSFSLANNDSVVSVDSATGEVTLSVDPDHETQSSYSFDVVAEDAAGNTSTQNIELVINDLDEVAPTITSGDSAGRIDENTEAGQVIYTAAADDSADISGGFKFSLSRDSAPGLEIDAETGVVTLVKVPDFESLSEYVFTVVATDAAGNSSEQAVTLDIDPVTEVRVTHWGSNIRIGNVKIKQHGQEIGVTDGLGDKKVGRDFREGEFEFEKEIDSSEIEGAITGADALAALKLSVGLGLSNTVSGNSYAGGETDIDLLNMAADFDNDGQVTGRDAFEILRYSVGLGNKAPTWMFVKNSAEIEGDDSSPEDAATYTALIKGDIDANWTSSDDQQTVVKDPTTQGGDVVYRFDPSRFEFSEIEGSQGVFSVDGRGSVTTNDGASGEHSFAISRLKDGKQKIITIEVEATDSSGPVFQSADQVAVASGIESGDVVYTAVAIDDSKLVKYSLDAASQDSGLSIHKRRGDVTLSHNTDESDAPLSFTVIATDLDGNSTSQTVTLSVLAVPDTEAPVFTSESAVTIVENSDSNVVYTAVAIDAYGSEVTYSLGRGSSKALTIDAETGVVSLSENADIESQASYKFVVIATDSEGNSSALKVRVNVENADELAPVFTSADSATVVENSGEDQVVYTAAASDADHDGEGTITYSLVDNTVYPEPPAAPVDNAQGNKLPAPEVQAGVQQVYVSESTVSGDQVILKIAYQADVAETTGIGFTVDFDGTQMQLNNVSNVFTGAIAEGALSGEGDAQSLSFGWASLFGSFPGSETADLAVLTFDLVEGSSNPAITITPTSNASTHTFAGSTHTVEESAPAEAPAASSDYVSADALSINESTGEVTLAHSPNYEALSDYSFTVVATDNSGNSTEQAVSLAVINTDEAAPEFTSGDTATIRDESGPKGQVIYTARVKDSADVSEGRVTFELSDDSDPALVINSNTGRVRLKDAPDGNQQDVYNFTVIATDTAGNASEQDVSLTLATYDATAPTITSGDQIDSIDENSGANQVVYTAESDDAETTWSLLEGSDAGLEISAEGVVTLVDNPDHEASAVYNFGVVATDAAGNSSVKKLSVEINDLDEMAPIITSGSAGSIEENSDSGQVIYDGHAIDSLDISGGVTYSIITDDSSEAYEPVSIPNVQSVYVEGSPTANAGEQVEVTVDYWADNNELTGLGLRIHFDSSVLGVADINNVFEDDLIFTNPTPESDAENWDGIDSTDTFVTAAWASLYGDWTSTGLPEDLLTVVFDVAGDAAGSTEIGFSTIDTALGYGFLGVNHELNISELMIDQNGDVSLLASPDYEAQSSYNFTVVATDAAGHTASQDVTVTVDNVDEVAPTITSSDAAANIDENSGSQVIYVAQSDDGGDVSHGSVSYSLADGHDSTIAINANSGEVFLLTNPDHESQSSYSFTVIATDAAGHATSKDVSLTINDLDDSVDTITSGATAAAIDENSGAGQVIYTATSEDLVDDSVNLVYSLAEGSDAALSINSATGEVTLTTDPDHEAQSEYSFGVYVTDGAGHVSATQSVTLDINDLDDAAPTVTSADAAAAIDENSGAAQVVYTATADDSGDDVSDGVTFSLADGSDAALSIDANSGEVTLAADPDHEAQSAYSFTVVATDAAGNVSASQSVTLDINDLDDAAPTITSGDTAVAVEEGTTGTIYSASADDSGDDVSGGVSFSLANADRTDLSIDATTGEVTLEESADASGYNFTVVATDAAGLSDQQDVAMAVFETVAAGGLQSGDGAIKQTINRNDDGSFTLSLELDASLTDVTDFSFDLNYSTASIEGSLLDNYIKQLDGFLDFDEKPQTMGNIQVSHMLGDSSNSGSFAELTFDLVGSSVDFSIENVTINGSAGYQGSTSGISINDHNATAADDVLLLDGGYSNVYTGEGVDTLIVSDQVDATTVVVDFESGTDKFDMSQLLSDAGYTADSLLDGAFGGNFDSETNVLELFVDTDTSEDGVSLETYEVTLGEDSDFDDDDLSADFSAFIA